MTIVVNVAWVSIGLTAYVLILRCCHKTYYLDSFASGTFSHNAYLNTAGVHFDSYNLAFMHVLPNFLP
jgi:hypothetical protein